MEAKGRKEDRRAGGSQSIPEVVGGRVGTAAARPMLVFRPSLRHNLIQVDGALLGCVKSGAAPTTKIVGGSAFSIHAARVCGRMALHPTLRTPSFKMVDGAVSDD